MKSLYACMLVALLLVLVAVRDTETKKMTMQDARNTIKNLRKTCAKKTDAPKDLLDRNQEGEFPDDERLKCYLKCMLVSTKAMKNDVILYDFFLKNARLMLIEELIPRVENVVEVCRNQMTSTDGCQLAFDFGQCVYNYDKEVILSYDYAENDTLVVHGSLNSLSTKSLRSDRRIARHLRSPKHHHPRHHRRRKAVTAVCRNRKTRPQCRRV